MRNPVPIQKVLPKMNLEFMSMQRKQTTISGQFRGITAYVYNTKQDTFSIDVQDNRLYIVAQALNSRGEWQDIEYNPSSWCGNSYYDIKLAPDEFWKFEIPVYDGDLPTMLRLKFDWTRGWTNDGEETKTIYSNTFPGESKSRTILAKTRALAG